MEEKKWPGIEQETTPGFSPTIPRLWGEEVAKALQIPPWLREMIDSMPPPPPPTFKQRIQRMWWRVLNWWPLEWKDRSEDDVDA